MITQPILAAKLKNPDEDIKKLRFPLWGTPKIDGIRCVLKPGQALSRRFKPIPNNFVRKWLEAQPYESVLDGELIVRDGQGNILPFNDIQSAIMTKEGEPRFQYLVFDMIGNGWMDQPWHKRQQMAISTIKESSRISPLQMTRLDNIEELLHYEHNILSLGYEGIMLRGNFSFYKCGRSTLKEQYLIALKRFEQDEATIIDFEERMHNANELTSDELGYAKRSSHQENLIPMNTLGALIVENPKWGTFKIGTGFTAEQAQRIWDIRQLCIGKLVTFRYQQHGTKDLPRIPSFKGFRNPCDL